jgi:hypothetical protein
MAGGERERAELRARQLWAAYGCPAEGYSEFLYQAAQEIALVDQLRKVRTESCIERLRESRRSNPQTRAGLLLAQPSSGAVASHFASGDRRT